MSQFSLLLRIVVALVGAISSRDHASGPSLSPSENGCVIVERFVLYSYEVRGSFVWIEENVAYLILLSFRVRIYLVATRYKLRSPTVFFRLASLFPVAALFVELLWGKRVEANVSCDLRGNIRDRNVFELFCHWHLILFRELAQSSPLVLNQMTLLNASLSLHCKMRGETNQV